MHFYLYGRSCSNYVLVLTEETIKSDSWASFASYSLGECTNIIKFFFSKHVAPSFYFLSNIDPIVLSLLIK
jgi:hypothetical protein